MNELERLVYAAAFVARRDALAECATKVAGVDAHFVASTALAHADKTIRQLHMSLQPGNLGHPSYDKAVEQREDELAEQERIAQQKEGL